MSPQTIFQINLVLGYLAWFLCFSVYILPRLRGMERFEAHRAIATLHSFRFIGLTFLLPGVAGTHLPAAFAGFAAYVDLATGLLALTALLTARVRPLFWFFVVSFNLVGVSDLLLDNYHAIRSGLPALAGELGSTYAIIILFVPLLMITHFVALYWLTRRARQIELFPQIWRVRPVQTSSRSLSDRRRRIRGKLSCHTDAPDANALKTIS